MRTGRTFCLRRQRAGGEGGEGAGRVVGLVEVERDRAALGQVGVEEAPRAVGLLSARRVAEDEEELLRVRGLEDAVEPHRLPLVRELGVAGARHRLHAAEDVRHGDRLRLRVGDVAGRHPVRLGHVEPAETRELAARPALAVAQPDREAPSPLDHEQAQPAQHEHVRLAGRVRPQRDRAGDAAPRDLPGDARLEPERDLAALQRDRAGPRRRRAGGQRERARGVAAERVVSLREPEEPRDGQPAVVGREPGLPLLAPLQDPRAVGVVGQRERRGESDREQSGPGAAHACLLPGIPTAYAKDATVCYPPPGFPRRPPSSRPPVPQEASAHGRCRRHAARALVPQEAHGDRQRDQRRGGHPGDPRRPEGPPARARGGRARHDLRARHQEPGAVLAVQGGPGGQGADPRAQELRVDRGVHGAREEDGQHLERLRHGAADRPAPEPALRRALGQADGLQDDAGPVDARGVRQVPARRAAAHQQARGPAVLGGRRVGRRGAREDPRHRLLPAGPRGAHEQALEVRAAPGQGADLREGPAEGGGDGAHQPARRREGAGRGVADPQGGDPRGTGAVLRVRGVAAERHPDAGRSQAARPRRLPEEERLRPDRAQGGHGPGGGRGPATT